MSISPINNNMYDKIVRMLNQRAWNVNEKEELDKAALRQLEQLLEAEEEIEEEKVVDTTGHFPGWTAEMHAARNTAYTLKAVSDLSSSLKEALYNAKLHDKYKRLLEDENLSAEDRVLYERARDFYAARVSDIDVNKQLGYFSNNLQCYFDDPKADGYTVEAIGGHCDNLTIDGLGLSGFEHMSIEEKIAALSRAVSMVDAQHRLAYQSAADYFSEYSGPVSWENSPFSIVILSEKSAESIEEYDRILRYFSSDYRMKDENEEVLQTLSFMAEKGTPISIEELYGKPYEIIDGTTLLDQKPTHFSTYREWYNSIFTHLDTQA